MDVVVDDGIVWCGQLSDGSLLHYVWIWIWWKIKRYICEWREGRYCFYNNFRCRRCSLNRTPEFKSSTCFVQVPFKFQIKLIDFTRVGSGQHYAVWRRSFHFLFFFLLVFCKKISRKKEFKMLDSLQVRHSGQLKYQVFPSQSFPN